MNQQTDELTHLVKNPDPIFMSMLRRLKLPHGKHPAGVMIPLWLDHAVKTYYKQRGSADYADLRLDDYLAKMFCGEDGTYRPQNSEETHETPGEAQG